MSLFVLLSHVYHCVLGHKMQMIKSTMLVPIIGQCYGLCNFYRPEGYDESLNPFGEESDEEDLDSEAKHLVKDASQKKK